MQRITWWPGDYLRDTGDLSLTEHGAYRVLLDHYYATDGRLKADQVSLFRICRAMTDEEQAAVGKVVRMFFTVDGDGNLHNKKADEIIAENQDYIRKAQEAGKKGSANRWGNGKGKGNPIANPIGGPMGNPMQTPMTASTTTTTNTKPLRAVSTALPGFDLFWKAWPKSPRKVAKAACEKKWRSLQLEPLTSQIVDHVAAAQASTQWRSGYEPAPLTYLNQRRWEDGAPADREEVKRFVI